MPGGVELVRGPEHCDRAGSRGGLRVSDLRSPAGSQRAARSGQLPLASGFGWLQSLPALIALGTATVLEVGAYYIPWLDHALDAVATPMAMIAGVLASAAVVTDLPPLLKWTIAIIGGGGAAGLIQGASVLLRLKSAALTGGAGNPVVSTTELFGAVGTALLAVLLPIVCLVAVIVLLVFAFRATGRLLFGRRPLTHSASGSP